MSELKYSEETFKKEQKKLSNRLYIGIVLIFAVLTLQFVVFMFCSHAYLDTDKFWPLAIAFVVEYGMWLASFYVLWIKHERARQCFVGAGVISVLFTFYLYFSVNQQGLEGFDRLIPILFVVIWGLRSAFLLLEGYRLYHSPIALLWQSYEGQLVDDGMQEQLEQYLHDYVKKQPSKRVQAKMIKNAKVHGRLLMLWSVCSFILFMIVSALISWIFHKLAGVSYMKEHVFGVSFVIMALWSVVAVLVYRRYAKGLAVYNVAWFVQVIVYGISLMLYMEAILNEEYSWLILAIACAMEIIRCYGYGILTKLYAQDPFLNGKYE